MGITEKKKEKKVAWDFQETMEMSLPFSLGLGQGHGLGPRASAWASDLFWAFENDRLSAFMLFFFFHFLFIKIREFPSFNCQ